MQGKGGWRECASFPFNQNYQPKKGSVEDQTITQPLYITISASNGDLSNRIGFSFFFFNYLYYYLLYYKIIKYFRSCNYCY